MGLIFNGNGDVIKAVDGSLTVEGLDLGGSSNVNAGIGTFSNLNVTGVLTYEDVKNVDSVGIVTARTGIHIDDSITHIGDTNTKIRFPAADTITAETGGSERFRIDSSGRVLIGTTTEGAVQAGNVTVSGTGDVGVTFRSTNSGTNRIFFSDATSGAGEYAGYINYDHSSNLMLFGTNESTRVRIDSSGRVLIGTTTEGHTSADDLTIATSGNTGITLRSGTSNAGNIYFSDATSGTAEYAGYVSYSHSTNALSFGTSDGTERLRIDSSGSLLIGGTSSSGATEKLRIENDSATSDVCQVTIISGNAERAILNFGDAQDHNIGRVTYDNTDNHMSLWTNNTERLRIKSDGNIGIGIASPDSLLHLEGSGSTAKIKLQRTGTTIGGSINARDESNDKGLTYLAKDGNSGYPMHVFQTDGGSGATERMRITHNGQLSIGAAQPTFNNPQPLLNIEKTSTGTGPLIFLYNHQSANTASTCEIRVGQNYREANRIVFGRENNNNWQSSAGGTASYMGFYTNSGGTLAERLRINSSGKVTIGNNLSQNSRLLYVETTHSSGGEVAYIGNSDSGNYGGLVISAGEIDRECRLESAWGDSFFTFWTQDSGGAGERMRITKSGDVFFGNTGSVNPGLSYQNQGTMIRTSAGDYICVSRGQNCPLFLNRDDSTGTLISLRYNGTERGTIQTDGTNVAYNTSSDYRLKENIIDMSGTEGIDIVKKLKPRKYNWIENRKSTGKINTVDGFIAHEVEEAGVLNVVSGKKDALDKDGNIDPQMLDYGQMTPVLAAAIKGLIDKVETLEAEVAALKSA